MATWCYVSSMTSLHLITVDVGPLYMRAYVSLSLFFRGFTLLVCVSVYYSLCLFLDRFSSLLNETGRRLDELERTIAEMMTDSGSDQLCDSIGHRMS